MDNNNDFVKTTTTYEGDEYNIRDARFPEFTKYDKGKMIRVDSEGHLILE